MKKKITPKMLAICVATVALSGLAITTFASDKLVVKNSLLSPKFVVNLDDVTQEVKVGIGVAQPTSKLHVNTYETKTDQKGASFTFTTEAAAGYGNIGIYSEATAASSTNSSEEVFGLNGVARTAIGNSANHGSILGVRFSAQHRGTGLLQSAIGVNAYPYNGSTGTINNAFALYTRPWMATGTINNWYGVFIDSANLGAGTIGKTYGIYVKEPTARNYFAGNVGIGTNNPTNLLQLSGGAYSDGNDWYPASSKELKENIVNVDAEEAIDTLTALEPVAYNYKNDPEEKHIGFIAEDVPNLVAMNARKNLSTMDITAVLTKVVQEQQKMIVSLQDQLAELKVDMQMKKDKEITLASAGLTIKKIQ